MDTSLSHGNAKRYPPIYDPSIIGDYNGEGLYSVESEDFAPGFGCVPTLVQRNIPDPPPVPDYRTAEQIKRDEDNMRYYFETIQESEAAQDEYLKSNGIT